MEEKDWLRLTSEKNQLMKVLGTNQYTQKFGLVLSEEDAKLLVQERRESLKEQQRVEFGGGILEKLIYAFCDSQYIYQDNYVEMMIQLQEIFYLYKNESMDELSDDELLDYMRKNFDDECEGSLEYLEDVMLERFARGIRSYGRNFIDRYQDIESEE